MEVVDGESVPRAAARAGGGLVGAAGAAQLAPACGPAVTTCGLAFGTAGAKLFTRGCTSLAFPSGSARSRASQQPWESGRIATKPGRSWPHKFALRAGVAVPRDRDRRVLAPRGGLAVRFHMRTDLVLDALWIALHQPRPGADADATLPGAQSLSKSPPTTCWRRRRVRVAAAVGTRQS